MAEVWDEFRRLRRTREGRVVAGVCSGVGARLGVDPVVLRVTTVVLTIFGGVGALLYALGWALLPEAETRQSVLDRHFGHRKDGRSDRPTLAGAIALIVVALFCLPWWRSAWFAPVLFVLAFVGLGFLAHRRSELGDRVLGEPAEEGAAAGPEAAAQPPATPQTHGSAGTPLAPGTLPTSGSSGGSGSSAAPGISGAPGSSGGPGISGTLPAVPSTPMIAPGSGAFSVRARENGLLDDEDGDDAEPRTPSWRDLEPAPEEFWRREDPLGLDEPGFAEPGLDGPGLDGPGPAEPVEAPVAVPRTKDSVVRPDNKRAEPARRPRRSRLLWYTLLTAFVLDLGLAIADHATRPPGGARVFPTTAYLAVTLGTIGVGLVIGTWAGRSRTLLVIGICVMLSLGVSAYARNWSAEIGDRAYVPRSVAAVRPLYDHGVGDVALDLRFVPFTDRTHLRTKLRMAAGDARVVVPENVDVTVHSHLRAGDLRLFGHHDGGTALQRTLVDDGADGPGGGTLVLDLDVGTGDVRVERG